MNITIIPSKYYDFNMTNQLMKKMAVGSKKVICCGNVVSKKVKVVVILNQ